MVRIIKCRSIIRGRAKGHILATNMPLSFWGGVDPETGRIIDPHHELFEQSISGKVLAFPYVKGSSGTPAVILELARQGLAPAAIINLEAEPLLISGPILCRHFYGIEIPMAVIKEKDYTLLSTGALAMVDANTGEIRLEP